MGSEDGEWILDEAAHPAGGSERGADPVAAAEAWLGGDEAWPEGGWPERDEPDDEWAAGDWPADPVDPRAEAGKRWGYGGFPGFSVWAAAAVAVLAAAGGVAAGLLLVKGTPTASAAGVATPGASAPGASAPGGSGSGPPAWPGPAGDGKVQILLTGRVVAVSATSITVGGAGPSVTAAVTRATKVTGAVHGITGVKAGDEVTAQVSGTPGHLIATAIQDPAR